MTILDLFNSPDILPEHFGDLQSTIEMAMDSLAWAGGRWPLFLGENYSLTFICIDHKAIVLFKPSDVQLFKEQYEATEDKESFLSERRKQASDLQEVSDIRDSPGTCLGQSVYCRRVRSGRSGIAG